MYYNYILCIMYMMSVCLSAYPLEEVYAADTAGTKDVDSGCYFPAPFSKDWMENTLLIRRGDRGEK